MKKNLKKFYAVTDSSSLYKAIIDKKPYLVKVDLRGQSRVGKGSIIDDGTKISICQSLMLFTPKINGVVVERQISEITTHYWGRGTSPIVALFKTKKEAHFCMNNHVGKNHDQYQDQWKKSTIEVLQAIGENHPYCSIETKSKNLWLMPPAEWKK